MAKIAPGEAFRITHPLTDDEVKEWEAAEQQYVNDLLSTTRRRDEERPAFTEEQLDEAEKLLKRIHERHTRPAQFKDDQSASAPPVYADGDDPLDRRDPGEYSSQMAAVAPVERLVMAPLAAVLGRDPYALLCRTELTAPMQRVLDTFNARLRCARLSKTEYATPCEITQELGFLDHVGQADNSLHLFAVYGRYAATCQLVNTGVRNSWLISAYCFTVAD